MESLPKQGLYRERSSEQLQPKIVELQHLESGTSPSIELSEAEKVDVLGFENIIGSKLESVFALKSMSSTVSLDYLKSPEGKIDFEQVFSLSLPESIADVAELRIFLYQHEAALKSANSKAKAEFEGRAKTFIESEITTALSATLTEDMCIDTSVIHTSASARILLTPEKTLEKISRLRELKQELKSQYHTFNENPSEIDEVKKGLIDLYLRRINEMLSDVSQAGHILRHKIKLGINLSDAEQELFNMAYEAKEHSRVAARYDRFQHGASIELNDSGYHPQVGTGLAEFTEQYAKEYNESMMAADDMMIQKGLNPELIKDENGFQPDQIRSLAEELLSSYNLLSTEDPEMYDPTRSGAATDEKWQVIVSDKYTSMAVSGKQKIVKIPNKPMSAKRLFSVGLAHEIEGHVLQHTNKAKLNLRLFQKVGADRSVIFAEGGAKFNEDLVSREAFGVPSPAHPHYIRAMRTKLEGGTYADCVQTFYESAIEPYRTLHTTGHLTTEQLSIEAKKAVKLAVRGSRRLFRGGDSTAENGQLSNSKDTAYLEGLILSRKLTEANLQKYMYLTGINLDAVTFLLQCNLISTDDIQGPTYKTLELWERERGRFELKLEE